jgi:hypothetical protein
MLLSQMGMKSRERGMLESMTMNLKRELGGNGINIWDMKRGKVVNFSLMNEEIPILNKD